MIKKLFLSLMFVLLFTVAAIAGVNINKADVSTLDSLPGIGAAKATAIVEYRKEHGNFKSVDDLRKVKGIGSKLMEKIRDKVTVEE